MFTGALDIKTAFLNALLKDDEWMEPPSNLFYLLGQLLLDSSLTVDQRRRIHKHLKHLKRSEKFKLLKALYGTNQVGRKHVVNVGRKYEGEFYNYMPAFECTSESAFWSEMRVDVKKKSTNGNRLISLR